MTIKTKITITCDWCNYKEPNNYGVKDWLFCRDESDEILHFCCKECGLNYSKNNNVVLFYIGYLTVNSKKIKKEFTETIDMIKTDLKVWCYYYTDPGAFNYRYWNEKGIKLNKGIEE